MAEPIGTALTVAGKAASAVVTPKLREKLLAPLFTAYGDHWGKEAEDRLKQRREERRASNVEQHVRAVALFKPRRTFDDVTDDVAFDEWIEGASAVDDKVDPDLADFWRAALVSIAEGDAARVRLVRIVKSLGQDDAVYLAAGSHDRSLFRPAREFANMPDYATRLKANGVFFSTVDVIRRQQRFVFAFLPMIVIAVVSYLATPALVNLEYKFQDPDLILRRVEALRAMTLGIVSMLLAFPALFFAQYQLRQAWSITPDGLRLLALLNRIRTGKSTPEAEAPVEQEAEAEVPKATKRTSRKRSTKPKEDQAASSSGEEVSPV